MVELMKKSTSTGAKASVCFEMLSGSQASDRCGQDTGSGPLTLWTIINQMAQ